MRFFFKDLLLSNRLISRVLLKKILFLFICGVAFLALYIRSLVGVMQFVFSAEGFSGHITGRIYFNRMY